MARISLRQLASLCQRFGVSLRAGADLLKMLNSSAGHGSSQYQEHLSDVADRVGRGETLAEAFRAQNGYFPDLVCELVDVGEQTGRLETVFLRLADHYQHLIALRRTFMAAIAWPVIELVLGILLVGGLIYILGLIGASTGVFGLLGASGAMIFFAYVGLAAFVIWIVVTGLQRGWFGPVPFAVVMRLPVVGNNIQTMALARMAWTLSLALDAGIDARRAIRLALASTQLAYYLHHLDEIEAVIARGGQFHEALARAGVFPREFLDALETAEVAGTESESLEQLSREYQARAELSSRVLAMAAGVLVWVLIGALLVFVILSLVIGLYIKPMNEAVEWATHPR